MANIKDSFGMTKVLKCFFYLIISIWGYGIKIQAQNPNADFQKIILDPGHGGKDSGTKNERIQEKDIVLQLAFLIEKKLKKNNKTLEIQLTRREDVFVPLTERAQIANQWNADLFISLHVNFNPKKEIDGIETYVVSTEKINTTIDIAARENSSLLLEENHEQKYKDFISKNPEFYLQQNLLQRDLAKKSIDLAEKIQFRLATTTQSTDRSVRQAGFVVLFLTKMPSVLIEIGFISNEKEEKKISDPKYLDLIAQAIAWGIEDYRVEKKPAYKALIAKEENQFFTIQLAFSSTDLALITQNFKGLSGVFKKEENGRFYYFYGHYKLREDAQKDLENVKKYYPDAFILQLNE